MLIEKTERAYSAEMAMKAGSDSSNPQFAIRNPQSKISFSGLSGLVPIY